MKIKHEILPMVTIEEFPILLDSAKICYMRKASNVKSCNHYTCWYQRRRNNLILKFLWDIGARVSEVAGVRIKDLHKAINMGHFDRTYTKWRKDRLFVLD